MNKLIVFGCDPGITGAIATFELQEKSMIAKLPLDMPSQDGMVDGELLHMIVGGHTHRTIPAVAIIEKVHGYSPKGRKSGTQSMFKFGKACGVLEGVMAANLIQVKYVTPQAWKKHYALDRDKKKSLALAREIWPEYTAQLKRVKDADRAEAMLIGLYGINEGLHDEAE